MCPGLSVSPRSAPIARKPNTTNLYPLYKNPLGMNDARHRLLVLYHRVEPGYLLDYAVVI